MIVMSNIKRYIVAHGWMEMAARTVLGGVFVLSAAVKVLDPYGTVLKMEEYFTAMGLEWLSGASVVLTVGLLAVEMLLGVALVLRAAPRQTAWAALTMNGLYLLLTLWVAVANPVADCGCFGDWLVLSNWQTFGKNVILTLLAVVVFLYRGEREGCRWGLMGALVAFGATVAFAIYSLIMLPVVEKFPFGEGVNIPEAVEKDLVASAEQSYVICRNMHSGELVSFEADDERWWQEGCWEFVELKSPTSELRVRPSEFVLHAGDYNLTPQVMQARMCRLLCVERLDRLSLKEIVKLRAIAADCLLRGDRVVVVTASPLIEAQTLFPGVEFCNLDPVVLRALLRAPAGMVSISCGTILHKGSLWGIRID